MRGQIKRHLVVAMLLFALLSLLPISISSLPTGHVAAESIGTINPSLFISSVPSYMIIGQNYTMQVLVTNHANVTLPFFVSIVAPVQYLLVDPLSQQAQLSSGESTLLTFRLIAYVSHSGQMNVTATLWIANGTSRSTPLLIESVTGQVFGTRSWWDSYEWPVAIVIGVVSVAAVAFVWSLNVRSKKRTRPPLTSGTQSSV